MKRHDELFFVKKRIASVSIVIGGVIIYLIAAGMTQYHFTQGLEAFPKALVWMIEKLVPDAKAMERLPKILSKLLETTLLSIAVTVIASAIAFVSSIFGSQTMGFNKVINRVIRIVAAFFRNVPDVVWAMILMFSFGQNILTGFFALFFTTYGLLTRSFIETIDEVSASSVEALRASGANFGHIIFQGIIPSVLTGMITWTLYMIETNIRNSTLIGILTATGIGYLFDMYYKRLEFGSASLVVLSIIILVIVIENIATQLRKVVA